MIRTLLCAAAILASATAAQAVSYTAVNGAPDPGIGAGNTLFVDFNSPVSGGFALTGAYAYATGTSSNAAAPAGDSTRYLYVSSALSPGSATLTSPFDLSQIGLYWGSIDTYNSVDVLGTRGGVQMTLYTLNGGSMPPADGNQAGATTNRRVTFTADAGELINGLRFTSTGVAFELDDISGRLASSGTGSTVPEPTTWAMLLAGFGLVGVASRRRTRATSLTA